MTWPWPFAILFLLVSSSSSSSPPAQRAPARKATKPSSSRAAASESTAPSVELHVPPGDAVTEHDRELQAVASAALHHFAQEVQ
jgi:hypothetical protein